jgi:putative spermidine/putrescine transport system ATP-binding protein
MSASHPLVDAEARDQAVADAASSPIAKGLPITIAGLSKSYGVLKAVDDLDLAVRSGEFVTLLGPSGSGKTTVLMIISGFLRPDRGSVRFGNREIVRVPPHRRNVGMVFQNYALFPHMSVGENVAYPLRIRRLDRRQTAQRVARALDLVRLGGLEARHVDQLSGGQRQRVALARALVFEPKILLLDEPLSALDKRLREEMQIEIRRLHRQLGMTTISVTHDQREALTMSDRVAVMNHGRLMQFDTPSAIYEQPANMFVAEFIGESYFLPVAVDGNSASLNGRSLRLAKSPNAIGAGPYRLLLRPEKLHFVGRGGGDGLNLFEGRVKETVFQGDTVVFYVELEGQVEVAVRHPNRSFEIARLPSAGETITLGLHAADTLVIAAAS